MGGEHTSTHSRNCYIPGHLFDIPVNFLVDTGADVTVVRRDVWDECSGGTLEPWEGAVQLRNASGKPLQVCGTGKAQITLGGKLFLHPVVIVDGLAMEALLGLDFIKSVGCILDIPQRKLIIKHRKDMVVPMESSGCGNGGAVANVTIQNTVQIPPGHEVELMGCVIGKLRQGPWLMEASTCLNKPIHVANGIVTPCNGCVQVRVVNPSKEDVTLVSGDMLGTLEHMRSHGIVVAGVSQKESLEKHSVRESLSPQRVAEIVQLVEKSSKWLSSTEKQQVLDLLTKYSTHNTQYSVTQLAYTQLCD